MKYLLKGIGLGFSLVLLEKIISLWLYGVYGDIIIWETPNEIKTMIISAVLFFIVTWGFLVSEKISGVLICGFSGLFFMFSAEIAYQINSGFGAFDASGPASLFFLIYGGGFFGSAAAVPLSLIMSAKGIKIRSIIKKEGIIIWKALFQIIKKQNIFYMPFFRRRHFHILSCPKIQG